MDEQSLVASAVHQTAENIDSNLVLMTTSVNQIKTFMDAKDKKIIFNGKRYAEFEDWQYAASFFGLKARSYEAKYIEIDGRKGFHAKAAVVDKNGIEVGSAEAYCMNDEPNWKSKPLFQLSSMAQTRAASKALSNIFRPLMRLAGYEGTPSEEVQDMAKPPIKTPQAKAPVANASAPVARPIVQDEPPEEIVQSTPPSVAQDEQIPFPAGPDVAEGKNKFITKAQQNMLFAKSRAAGIHEDRVKKTMELFWNLKHTSDLRMWQLDKLCEMIDKGAIV